MKKSGIRIFLGLLVVAGFMLQAAHYLQIPVLTRLELIAYDTRVRMTMPGTVDDRIVIVDIDEKSLAEEGRWPWRRNRLAALLDKLFDHYGATVVGLDIVLSEKDESSGLDTLREMARSEFKDNPQFGHLVDTLAPKLEYDRVLAESLRGRPVVLGYYFSAQSGLAIGALPPPVLAAGSFTGRNIDFSTFPGYGSNLGTLQKAAASAGHFNPEPDVDGILRRVPMLVRYQDAFYEPLALAMVRVLFKSPPVVPGYPADSMLNRGYPGLEWLEAGPVRVPVDATASALAPYRGPQGSFPYVSASDVLRERTPVDGIRGRMVLIGTTAPGLQDIRSAPVANLFPGVEIHANLIAGILDGSIKQRPPYVLGAEIVLLGIVGTLLSVTLAFMTPLRATALAAVTLVGVAGVNLAVWRYGNLVLPVASGLAMVVTLFSLNMSYGYFSESRAKQRMTGLFGQYVPPELVDEMSLHPERFSMEGESREMTVLFSDVRGFTSISEGLEPKTLSRLMNDYLTPMTRVIHGQRGTIDKYMGDAIMAFWGAPLEDPQHARHAVLAGLEMNRRLDALASDFQSKGWPALKIGVGVNTGRMSVGNMGSEIRVAYTVMSDTVNLASRLEGLTKRYGVSMLVGEATRAAVPDVAFREVDRVRVKGKEEPVTIHEPLGLQTEVPKAAMDRVTLFQQVLKFYRAQEWDMAELQLLNLQRADPADGLYAAFLERITHLRAHPPGTDWDGIFDFDSK
ncbi:MAG: adenylate/guanylate cyclase domain-containing protein [Betaproteobacteria bacterium]|jgi:adenylate cyclase